MKKCKQGYYYCHTDKKCKRIPTGYRVGLGGYLRKENGEEQGENDNADNTNGNGNGNGNSNGGSNGGGVSEGTLHKWFAGSKSKGKGGKKGTPGWVNVLTGGTCASDEPGEGVPKCVSRDKYDSMTPAERRSAARRKKKEDPGQQQKSGAAKPTYVSTDKPKKKKKKKMKEAFDPTKKSSERKLNTNPGEKPDSPQKYRKDSEPLRKHRERFGDLAKEEVQVTEGKDKKGKGSGTKDACYHKVKSRYSVWPSAYASGALVKCRKVGAANWGNKSEEMDYTSFAAKAKETQNKIRDKVFKKKEQEKKEDKKEEWAVNTAAEYLFNEGLNEDGVAIFIEELGLESFAKFVYELGEEVLTEAKFDRLPPVSKTGKKIADLKGGAKASSIKSKRKIRATLRQKVDDESKSKPGFASFSKKVTSQSKKDNTSKAVASAKKQQPKKRGILDRVAGEVLKGMERHRKAMDAARETGKTISKAAKVGAKGAKEFGKGVKAGLNTTRKVGDVARKAVTASESVQYSDWRDDFKAMEYEFIDLIKPEPLVSDNVSEGNKSESQKIQEGGNFMRGKDSQIARSTGAGALTPDAAKQLGPKAEELRKKKASKTDIPGFTKKKVTEGKYSDSETYVRGTAPVRDPQTGELYYRETHKKKSKKVKEEVETISERGPHGRTKSSSRTGSSSEKPQRRLKSRRFERFGNPGRSDYLKARRAELDRMGVAANHADAPLVDEAKVETIDEAGKKCWKGYKKAGTQKLFGKTYNRCVKANEEFVDEERSARRAKNPRKYADVKKEIDKKEHQTGGITDVQKYKIEKKAREERSKNTNFSSYRTTGSRGHGTDGDNPRISYIRNQYEIESDWRSEIEEGAAWTKKSGKNPSGGLNEKGRKSYERENPGSDLKRPSKKKGNKRRKSFCARMKGMKKKLTSKKTANDPNSRINKSLRAWNC